MPFRFPVVAVACLLLSCHTTRYFVVRHAEKGTAANMSTDVPLSDAGKGRAQALRTALAGEKIAYVFSTNTQRTRGTAQPLADALHLPVRLYDPRDTAFISLVKNLGKGNVLVVGHSNTVDDIVNGLAGTRYLIGDLPDSAYGDLFVVTKKGKKTSFKREHFGK